VTTFFFNLLIPPRRISIFFPTLPPTPFSFSRCRTHVAPSVLWFFDRTRFFPSLGRAQIRVSFFFAPLLSFLSFILHVEAEASLLSARPRSPVTYPLWSQPEAPRLFCPEDLPFIYPLLERSVTVFVVVVFFFPSLYLSADVYFVSAGSFLVPLLVVSTL